LKLREIGHFETSRNWRFQGFRLEDLETGNFETNKELKILRLLEIEDNETENLEILRPRRFGDFGILRSLRFTNRRF
jgi:hypothetical protein